MGFPDGSFRRRIDCAGTTARIPASQLNTFLVSYLEWLRVGSFDATATAPELSRLTGLQFPPKVGANSRPCPPVRGGNGRDKKTLNADPCRGLFLREGASFLSLVICHWSLAGPIRS